MAKTRQNAKKQNKVIYTDIHKARISENGVEDFYWPLLHTAMDDFALSYIKAAITLINEVVTDPSEVDIYKFTLKYVIAEAAGIYQGELLRTRFVDDNIVPVAPKDWDKWPYLFSGDVPPPPRFLEKFRRSAEKPKIWQRLKRPGRIIKLIKQLRFQKGGVEIDGLKVLKLTPEILAKNIIATHRSELIAAHADQVKEDVVFCRSARWFEPVSEEEELAAIEAGLKQVEAGLVAIAEDLYKAAGLNMAADIKGYIAECLSQMAALLRVHYNRLLKREDLPRRLWTGTGGNIWALMVRKAVMEKGGQTTGHDHGGGTCHVNIPVIGFIELWACDRFITFTEQEASDMTKAASFWPLLSDQMPVIERLQKKSESPLFLQKKFEDPDCEIKKVYLLSTLYDRDRGRIFSFYPDLIYTDWQARLISKLTDWGYEVYFKPHPESPTPPPEAFKELGARIVDKRFEEVMTEADLFIFDYTYTSTFMPALQSNTPLMLIDFIGLNWYEKAYQLAQQRCAIIEGGFDHSNRVQIDWNAVQDGVQDAIKKCNNHEFFYTYFG